MTVKELKAEGTEGEAAKEPTAEEEQGGKE